MMRKFKMWLIERFLPVYLKESLLKENDRLRKRVEDLGAENQRLEAYISGLTAGNRRSIKIYNYTGRDDK